MQPSSLHIRSAQRKRCHLDRIGIPVGCLENAAAGAVAGVVEAEHGAALGGGPIAQVGGLAAFHVAFETGEEDDGGAGSGQE